MSVTMALIVSAVSPAFSKEDSHGAWDLTNGIKKTQILSGLSNFLTSFELSLLTTGDYIFPPLERAVPGSSQSSQWVAMPLR